MDEMTRMFDEKMDRELHISGRTDIARKRAKSVVGSSVDPERKETVVSEHPAMIRYQTCVSARMRKLVYQYRPISSLWMPKQSRHDPERLRCPKCNGTRENFVG